MTTIMMNFCLRFLKKSIITVRFASSVIEHCYTRTTFRRFLGFNLRFSKIAYVVSDGKCIE